MSAPGFAAFQEHDRRLVLLRGLAAAAQYRANAYLLRRYCDAVGHVVSADRIEADLAWLADSGLVALAGEGGVTVATLTPRGLDVSTGRTDVPGVARPQPGG
ncbi:MAG TPA: ArsR family transcriptional regulator [Ottowia sp.]|nr:ArsR family transcriptional regulator [Ottowia sp.]